MKVFCSQNSLTGSVASASMTTVVAPPAIARARRGLAVAFGLLLSMLLSTTVHADGLGGLAALRTLAFIALIIFCAVWALVWVLVRWYLRSRRKDRKRTVYWLRNQEIPPDLRALCLVQYIVAFGYMLRSFSLAVFPFARHNGHIAEFLVHNIVFGFVFATLLIVVANGAIKRSYRWGYKAGMWLGAIAIVNPLVYWIAYGGFARQYGPEMVSPLFGLVFILLLGTRFYKYYGAEQKTLKWLRALKVTAISVAVALLLLVSSSYYFTGGSAEKAEAILDNMAEAVEQYRADNGDWPATLDDIDPSVQRRYRFSKIQYDREAREIHLYASAELTNSEHRSSLLYRCSFGVFGEPGERISGIGRGLG